MAKNNVYIIPDNFIEGGKIFNGMFKIRNLIEAAILGLVIGFPMWQIPYPSLQIRITVMVIVVLPVVMLAVAGINGDSLIEFITHFFQWRRSKRVMLYNTNLRTREVRAADVIEAQEMPKDRVVDAIDSWKEKRKQDNQTIFIENEDFKFEEEQLSSSYLEAERRILGIDKNSQKQKKKDKKKKKSKNKNLLLAETNETHNEYTSEILSIDNDEVNEVDVVGEEEIIHVEN